MFVIDNFMQLLWLSVIHTETAVFGLLDGSGTPSCDLEVLFDHGEATVGESVLNVHFGLYVFFSL